eukprot:scaffold587_cov339-Pavlova_lutheri.AAC.26
MGSSGGIQTKKRRTTHRGRDKNAPDRRINDLGDHFHEERRKIPSRDSTAEAVEPRNTFLALE